MVGVDRGLQGLINQEFIPMSSRSVADIIHRGGTILKSARSEAFKTPEGERAVEPPRKPAFSAMVVIGGDGSFRGAPLPRVRWASPRSGCPRTIDNDIACTDASIGFDTAVNTAVDGINKIGILRRVTSGRTSSKSWEGSRASSPFGRGLRARIDPDPEISH